jgi:hypothetical protein
VGNEVGGGLPVVEIALGCQAVERRRDLIVRETALPELRRQLGAEMRAARQELSRLFVDWTNRIGAVH